MKRLSLLIFILLLIVVAFLLINQRQTKKSQEVTEKTEVNIVDYRASFAIFTNGTFRVFTASMYHNLSADVFIQADNPNVVHVKKNGIIWNDFFKTLPFKLTDTCLTTGTGETFCSGENGQLKFYLNGVKTDSLLGKIIQNGDRALITFGKEDETQIQNQLEQVPAIK